MANRDVVQGTPERVQSAFWPKNGPHPPTPQASPPPAQLLFRRLRGRLSLPSTAAWLCKQRGWGHGGAGGGGSAAAGRRPSRGGFSPPLGWRPPALAQVGGQRGRETELSGLAATLGAGIGHRSAGPCQPGCSALQSLRGGGEGLQGSPNIPFTASSLPPSPPLGPLPAPWPAPSPSPTLEWDLAKPALNLANSRSGLHPQNEPPFLGRFPFRLGEFSVRSRPGVWPAPEPPESASGPLSEGGRTAHLCVPASLTPRVVQLRFPVALLPAKLQLRMAPCGTPGHRMC